MGVTANCLTRSILMPSLSWVAKDDFPTRFPQSDFGLGRRLFGSSITCMGRGVGPGYFRRRRDDCALVAFLRFGNASGVLEGMDHSGAALFCAQPHARAEHAGCSGMAGEHRWGSGEAAELELGRSGKVCFAFGYKYTRMRREWPRFPAAPCAGCAVAAGRGGYRTFFRGAAPRCSAKGRSEDHRETRHVSWSG